MWRQREYKSNSGTLRDFAFLAVVLLLVVGVLWAGLLNSAEEIRGRAIDFDTGNPISGVAVVAIWELRGIEGAFVRNMAVQEAISDEHGRFRIPGWGLQINSRFLYAGLPENAPQLIFFRRDYEPLLLDNNYAKTKFGIFVKTGEMQDADQQLRRWSVGSGGRVTAGQQVDAEIRHVLTAPDCEWQQIPALLVELHHLGLATTEAGGRSLMLNRIPNSDCGNAETNLTEML